MNHKNPPPENLAKAQVQLQYSIAYFICAAVLLFLALIFIFSQNYSAEMLVSLAAIPFGFVAFNHLEKSAQFKIPLALATRHAIFTPMLKDKSIATIDVYYQVPPDYLTQEAHDRLMTEITGTLNHHFSRLDDVPEDPYPAVNQLLAKTIESEIDELGVPVARIRATRIEVQGTVYPASDDDEIYTLI